jgi:A/G-specific adenine glycosylase
VSPGEALLSWYECHGRDLPWRRTRDPYAVLISEVMLQQTQVARVLPRYEAWLERWPSAHALAEAPLAEVLRAWVGLGYNRRAVRLWEACRVVAAEGWPDDLRQLPGVGPYTADALAAFAWDRPVVPVDTNVRRVFARLGRSLEGPPALGHALMDLGATVCTARAPRCSECPVTSWCGGPEPVERRRARSVRFEDTDRWARGRVVAALAVGEALPDLEPERYERVVEGLLRDGLAVRDASGLRLP